MRRTISVITFILIFACVFVMCGLFLQPLLPPHPDHPVSAFEGEFWITNWVGAVLGLGAASLNAWLTAKRRSPHRAGTSAAD